MDTPLDERPEGLQDTSAGMGDAAAGGGVATASPPVERIPGESRVWGKGLTKIYRKRRVVDDVDIEVSQG